MRPLNFAIACAFSSVVFFGHAAPANYQPSAAKIVPDAPKSEQTDSKIALPAPVIDKVEPSVQGSEPVAPETPNADSEEKATPRKPTSLERARTALAESNAPVLSDHELCEAIVEVARANDLPVGFFASLIWQESRFDHEAISPVGAMGIAQFMPDTADAMSVDAFDARSALPGSAKLLRTLRARFGNLGLAAAAYNAGPKRVSDWLAGRSGLPKETQDYVSIITGRAAVRWQDARSQANVYRVPRRVPCHRSAAFVSVEQAERVQQEQRVAEEARIAAQKAREAAARRLAEAKEAAARRVAELKEARKAATRTARLQLASRVKTTKSQAANAKPEATKVIIVRNAGRVRVAQVKR